MSGIESSRRTFLKLLGLSAGATLAHTDALAGFVKKEEILRLNPEQQEFMLGYGQWMDQFIEVIRIQKTAPDDLENNKKMMALSDQSEAFKSRLEGFMKDSTFALIYTASIERMKKEI